MQLIVLDTNCLLQILPSRSKYHIIWERILNGEISLCVNTEILEEYEEIIANKTTPLIARNIVEAIARLASTYFQTSYIHFRLIEVDADDNKFVDCAIAAGAEYIVSNTIEWPVIKVVKIDAFYSMQNE